MRAAVYLERLPPPKPDEVRRRAALESLLEGCDAAAGEPIDLPAARWPSVADRLLTTGHEELARIHAALRSGLAPRSVLDPRDVSPPAPSPAVE